MMKIKKLLKFQEKNLPVTLPNIEKLDTDGNPLNNVENGKQLQSMEKNVQEKLIL